MDIEQTLAERGQRYGVFAEHAEIVQQLKTAMHPTPGWRRLAADQKQALETIADKIARILNGDPDYLDNWHDIIGYARLVEQRLERDAQFTKMQADVRDALRPGIVGDSLPGKGYNYIAAGAQASASAAVEAVNEAARTPASDYDPRN